MKQSGKPQILMGITGLLLMSAILAVLSACSGTSEQNTRTDVSVVYTESEDEESGNDEPSDLSGVTSKDTEESMTGDLPEPSEESSKAEASEQISQEASVAGVPPDDSQPEEIVPSEDSAEPSGEVQAQLPVELSEMVNQYTDETSVLDLDAMLRNGMGLSGAQSGDFGSNYSIGFGVNGITHEDAPDTFFVYSLDGVMQYSRTVDGSGWIHGKFRNNEMQLTEEDLIAIYRVFEYDDLSGWTQINQ